MLIHGAVFGSGKSLLEEGAENYVIALIFNVNYLFVAMSVIIMIA